MFPNYTAPPSVAVQRTLKALAKPIMSLAFLVEGSEQNQQDKATNDFVEVGPFLPPEVGRLTCFRVTGELDGHDRLS